MAAEDLHEALHLLHRLEGRSMLSSPYYRGRLVLATSNIVHLHHKAGPPKRNITHRMEAESKAS